MNDKICFLIVSHGKMDHYDLQAHFFNKFRKITNYDIVVWDNSNTSDDVVKSHLTQFNVEPVSVYTQQHNPGYHLGNFHAIHGCYDILKNYKYVVHMTVDSFIVDENPLNDFIVNMDVCDADLLSNQFMFHPKLNAYVTKPTFCLGGDFFMFNPSRFDISFWETLLQQGYYPPELTLYKLCTQLEKAVMIWTRMHPTVDGRVLCAPTEEERKGYRYRYFADTAGVLHTHDLIDLDKYK